MSKHKQVVSFVTCDAKQTVRNATVMVEAAGLTCEQFANEAVNRAVRKVFGARAYFSRDSMRPGRYGQVWKPAKGDGSVAVTDTIRVLV